MRSMSWLTLYSAISCQFTLSAPSHPPPSSHLQNSCYNIIALNFLLMGFPSGLIHFSNAISSCCYFLFSNSFMTPKLQISPNLEQWPHQVLVSLQSLLHLVVKFMDVLSLSLSLYLIIPVSPSPSSFCFDHHLISVQLRVSYTNPFLFSTQFIGQTADSM